MAAPRVHASPGPRAYCTGSLFQGAGGIQKPGRLLNTHMACQLNAS
jgi:hypothetical protein